MCENNLNNCTYKMYFEIFIMNIPNNSLTNEIKSIVRSSQNLKESYYFNFSDPATEDADQFPYGIK